MITLKTTISSHHILHVRASRDFSPDSNKSHLRTARGFSHCYHQRVNKRRMCLRDRRGCREREKIPHIDYRLCFCNQPPSSRKPIKCTFYSAKWYRSSSPFSGLTSRSTCNLPFGDEAERSTCNLPFGDEAVEVSIITNVKAEPEHADVPRWTYLVNWDGVEMDSKYSPEALQ